MLQLILAVDEEYGIGKNGLIPWRCKEDLLNFKKITDNSTLIMGRKTCDTLPYLSNRTIMCMSRGVPDTSKWKNEPIILNNVNEVETLMKANTDVSYFVAGGENIYRSFIHLKPKIHISYIKGKYDCDTFVSKNMFDGYVITSSKDYADFKYCTLEYNSESYGEIQYTNIMKKILKDGTIKNCRNGKTLSLFCEHMKFDLRDGFPLLTTKKMFIRGIIEELLFFLKGETDSTLLESKNVNIWKGNTTSKFIKNKNLPYSEGVMGPMYGYQWRHFNCPYLLDDENKPIKPSGGIDQFKNVVDLVKNDPNSRRILLTTYNPLQAEEGVLYPCHSIVNQFYVDGDFIDMFCYNRSQDFFLGTPYNIASSSILLIIISKLTNKKPRYFNLSMGDTHLYLQHKEAARIQIKNMPYKKPTIEISKDLKNVEDIETLTYSDFKIKDYICHKTIKAEMIA